METVSDLGMAVASMGIYSIVTPTRFCAPIMNIEELRIAIRDLRSIIQPGGDPPEAPSMEFLVRRQLEESLSPDLSRPPADETGHQVVWILLLAPFARERSKRLARRDEAANGKPLLVSVLLPEVAFNLSDVEAAYGFSLEQTLEEQTGHAGERNLVLHRDVVYLDCTATFAILSHEHPGLLVALAYGTILRNSPETPKIHEVLRNLNEELTATECQAIEHLYSEDISDLPEAIRKTCSEIMRNHQDLITCILAVEEIEVEVHTTNWYLRHIIGQTLESLLGDEVTALDDLYAEDETFPEVEAVALDEQYTAATPMTETSPGRAQDIDRVKSLCKFIRTVKRRVFLLRQSIPSEI